MTIGKTDNTVEITKDTYHKQGKSYIRVTRVLDIIAKPEFYRWYAKHGYAHCIKVRDDRAAFGSRMHKEFQNWLSDENVWIDDQEMQVSFDMFKEWVDLHKLKPLELEYRLFNDELLVGGTCDFIGYMDDKFVLLDWKTSKRAYDNYKLQVAIYLFMYEQMTGDKVLGGAGIVCFRDGKIIEKYLSRDECMKLVEVFRAARILYRWKYGK